MSEIEHGGNLGGFYCDFMKMTSMLWPGHGLKKFFGQEAE